MTVQTNDTHMHHGKMNNLFDLDSRRVVVASEGRRQREPNRKASGILAKLVECRRRIAIEVSCLVHHPVPVDVGPSNRPQNLPLDCLHPQSKADTVALDVEFGENMVTLRVSSSLNGTGQAGQQFLSAFVGGLGAPLLMLLVILDPRIQCLLL
ncbi:unnamed protein product [Periconia digitata]|uniref:Uncharacterized protein n=1 Tax=Periconia digitata TaxID=1303443 RepID=A0A9W4UJK4_9PLEO|nr:unnamed protein product [Periconia digitata]